MDDRSDAANQYNRIRDACDAIVDDLHPLVIHAESLPRRFLTKHYLYGMIHDHVECAVQQAYHQGLTDGRQSAQQEGDKTLQQMTDQLQRLQMVCEELEDRDCLQRERGAANSVYNQEWDYEDPQVMTISSLFWSSAVKDKHASSSRPDNILRVGYLAIVENTSENKTEYDRRQAMGTLSTGRTPMTNSQDTIYSIGDARRWLKASHNPENVQMVNRVKNLLTEASQTPRDNRTAGQHYLLKNWKDPLYIDSSTITPSSTQTREIIVDASHYGVGFIYQGVGWQGWKFNHGPLIPYGPDNKIIMSWAELIAVEVGLRTYVALPDRWASLVLRTDNQGVIKALTEGVWQEKYSLNRVLQRILGLLREHDINLHMRWIPTGSNVADPISRGVYPRSAPIWLKPPPLPAMLQDILTPGPVYVPHRK